MQYRVYFHHQHRVGGKRQHKKVNEFFQNLTPELAFLSSPSELLDEFEKHIVDKALEVAPKEEKQRPDWFTEDESNLMDLIKARNVAYEAFINNSSDDNQHKLKEARHALLRSERKAKRKWQLEFALKCQKLDFKINPKDAWEMVFKLMEGFQSHHKTYIPKNFKNKSGIEAKNDTDNAKILNTHFYSLFNSKVQVDYSVPESISQRETASQLDKAPSKKEIRSAINVMAHDIAQGCEDISIST